MSCWSNCQSCSMRYLHLKCMFVALVQLCSFTATVATVTQKAEILLVHSSTEHELLEKKINCAVNFIENLKILPNEWNLSVSLRFINEATDPTGVSMITEAGTLSTISGLMAVVGPTSSRGVQLFHPHAVGISVPHFSPIAADTVFDMHDHFPWLISMTNSYDEQISAVVETIVYMGWSNIAILCAGDSYYQSVAQSLWDAAEKRDITVRGVRIFDEVGLADARDHLLAIKQSGQRIVVLLCEYRVVESVLKEAEMCGMTSQGWAWVLWSDVMNRIDMNQSTLSMNNRSQPLVQSLTGFIGVRMRPEEDASTDGVIEECELRDVFEMKYAESVLAFAYGLRSLLASVNETLNPHNTSNWQFDSHLMQHILSPSNDSSPFNRIVFDQEKQMVARPSSFDIVNLHDTGWKFVGYWDSPSYALHMDRNEIVLMGGSINTSDYVTELRYQTLDVVTISSPPFVFIETVNTSGNKNNLEFTGYAFDLLAAMKENLGFSYNVRAPPSEVIGSRDSYSGRWNGLIGELVGGRADLVVAPLTITSERASVVDFAKSFFKTGLKYIIDVKATRGIMSGYERHAFLLPFTWTLWGVIGASVLALACFLAFISRLSPYGARGHYFQSEEADEVNIKMERRRSSTVSLMGCSTTSIFGRRRSSVIPITESTTNHDDDGDIGGYRQVGNFRRQSNASLKMNIACSKMDQEEDDDFDTEMDARSRAERQMSFSNALYFAFAGLLWQSPESVPRAPSSRIAAAIWYMVGVIVVASYTANMVTFVTKTTESAHLLHVRELITQSVVTPGTITGTSVDALLISSNIPIAEKLYEAILQNPAKSLQPTQAVAMDKVSKGELALIWESAMLDYAAATSEDCRLKTVALGLGEYSYAFALRKDSPLTEQFSHQIQIFHETGFLEELHQKYFGLSDSCTNSEDIDDEMYTPLTYSSLAGVFDMLFVATGISLLVLLLEWLVSAISDVDCTDPNSPATLKRAFVIRWERLIRDIRDNWLPLKRIRKICHKFRWRKKERASKQSSQLRRSVESDQWKRYTSSEDAAKLRPGDSISVPDIISADENMAIDPSLLLAFAK